jgi:uncharacterized circularly permuted ATP-grasp superfamily protein
VSEELALVTAANEPAWNAACERIKAARAGAFPSDWWARVMQSGLMRRVVESWKMNHDQPRRPTFELYVYEDRDGHTQVRLSADTFVNKPVKLLPDESALLLRLISVIFLRAAREDFK